MAERDISRRDILKGAAGMGIALLGVTDFALNMRRIRIRGEENSRKWLEGTGPTEDSKRRDQKEAIKDSIRTIFDWGAVSAGAWFGSKHLGK